MRKILFLIVLSIIVYSCAKQYVSVPLSYSVVTSTDSPLSQIFIPAKGTYDLAVKVKFLTGNPEEKVSLKITGLPDSMTVTPDSMSGVPTYTQHFVFTDSNAKQGTYPVTLTATSPTTGAATYQFNITVIPTDCAALFFGNLTGKNACSARNYTYSATGSSAGTNKLAISNFGGYGVTVTANISCAKDSVTIPNMNYGNGVVLSGYGFFTSNKLVIYYTATSLPTGGGETCIDTLSL